MSEFRDAIASLTFQRSASVDPADWGYHLDDADAVLAMPEMQAIRKALREVDRHWWIEGNWRRGEWLKVSAELPDSVIAWVLDEGSNP